MRQKRSSKNIQSLIKSFLEQKTGRVIVSSSVDLVKKGIINSLTMFELIGFIEKEFKIKVDVLSINPDNFNSLGKITKQITAWILK